MQFLSGVFSGQANNIVTAFFALVFVLALIVFGMWAVKIAFHTTSRFTRTRGRRLTIVERLPVDGRRQLLIVRRDKVEHVIMTGGGHDIVVESNIPVEEHVAAVTQANRPVAAPAWLAPRKDSDTAVSKPAEAPTATLPPKVAMPVVAAMAPMQPTARSATTVPPTAPAATPPAAPQPLAAPPEPVPIAHRVPGAHHGDDVHQTLAGSLQRRVPSLRHTALLRPVSIVEPAVVPMPPVAGDKSGRPPADSDKMPEGIDGSGRNELGKAASFGDKSGAGSA